MRKLVLVTRPQPDADRLTAQLVSEGYQAMAAPLFETVFTGAPLPQTAPTALVATSRNALLALDGHNAKHLFHLPFYAVGAETAQAAREAGFEAVTAADGDVVSLCALIKAQQQTGTLLYLAGAKRKPVLETQLSEAGFSVQVWESYDMTPLAGFLPQVQQALEQRLVGTVLLFSERAATRFLKLILPMGQTITATPDYFCLSPEIAAPFQQRGLRAYAAARPDMAALLHLLAQKNIR